MFFIIILRLLESYFRHRWLYLLPIVMMAGFSVLYLLTAKPVYQTAGVVYVQEESLLSTLNAVTPESFLWVTPAQAKSTELSDLLNTDAFIRAIIQGTDLEDRMDMGPEAVGETIYEVRNSVWVEPAGDNQLVVAAAHEDRTIAHQLVNSVIENHIQWQIAFNRNESESAQEFFGNLIEVYQVELAAARQAMEDFLLEHPEPVRGERPAIEELQIERLNSEIELASIRYSSALDKEENARLAMAQVESDVRQTYFLIDAPVLPESPDTSMKDAAVNMIIFVIIGVMLSVGLIVAATLIDRSIRFPIDIRYTLELPVLTQVPDLTPASEKKKRRFGRKKKAQEPDNLPSTELKGQAVA